MSRAPSHNDVSREIRDQMLRHGVEATARHDAVIYYAAASFNGGWSDLEAHACETAGRILAADRPPFRVGDLVESVPGHQLSCGQMRGYRVVVCVSVEPFVLVSVGGSMMWSSVPADEVQSLGPAANHDVDCDKAMRRWKANELRG